MTLQSDMAELKHLSWEFGNILGMTCDAAINCKRLESAADRILAEKYKNHPDVRLMFHRHRVYDGQFL